MSTIVIYPDDCYTPSIYTGGEEGDMKIENLLYRNWNTFWQNDYNDENVLIDFDTGGDLIRPNYLALGNHNLNDTDYGIKFQYGTGGTGASFTSAGYLLGAAGAYHDYVGANENIWLETLTAPATGYQYFRLTIENSTGVKPKIAVVSFGVSVNLKINYENGSSSRGYVYNNVSRETIGGQIKTNLLSDIKASFNLSFNYLDEVDKNKWQNDIFEELEAENNPFFFKDVDDNSYYVRITNGDLMFNDSGFQNYAHSISFIEESKQVASGIIFGMVIE